MPSQVEVCNLALTFIGARSTIAALYPEEQSEEARHCSLIFDAVRDATLAAHDWPFARARVALASLGDPPDSWSYRYAYPTNCLQALYIEPVVRTDIPAAFEVAAGTGFISKVILTDEENAVLVYTGRVTTPAVWSPAFVWAFAWALAAAIALPITNDPKMARVAQEGFFAAISAARAAAGNETQRDRPADADWIQARA